MRRLLFAMVVLVVLAAPQPASAGISQLMPALDDATPNDFFSANDALFVNVNVSDFRGGVVCVVREDFPDDVSDGKANCYEDAAWGSPNVVFGFGWQYAVPIEGPYLKVGTWRLLGDGGPRPGDDVLGDFSFTVSACPGCDTTIAEESLLPWKLAAAANVDFLFHACHFYYAEWVRLSLGGQGHTNLPRNEVKAANMLRIATCRNAFMYRDIYNDPPDPNYTSVQAPVFQTVPASDFPGAHDAAVRLEAQHGYGRAQLTAFERYLGAVEDDAAPYVHAQTAAVGEYGGSLVQEMRRTTPALNQLADAFEANPVTADPVIPDQAALDEVTALVDGIRTNGFTAEQTTRLVDLGFSGAEIAELETAADAADLSVLEIGVDLKTVTNDLAAGMEPQQEAFDVFEREATSVAATTNQPPSASFTATPTSGAPPLEVSFTDTSTSPDLDPITSLAWDFGDGATGTGASRTHTYTTEGNFTVTLTACDYLACASATKTITVAPVNADPVATLDTLTTAKNSAGTVNVLANDSDPDGNAIAVTAWTQGAHGFVTCNFAGSCTYTPATDYVGPDSFTYTIEDGKGGTATGTVDVTVSDAPPANRDPVAVDDVLVTAVNEAKAINVLRNDSDLDGDPLDVIDWTNGDNPTGGGTVDCTHWGQCTYTPPPDLTGSEEFTYTVSDRRGGTDVGTVSVTVEAGPANRNPVAVNDELVTLRNQAANVKVLANDSDPDGDAIRLAGWTHGAHGSVDCPWWLDNVCVYHPATNFTGTDEFTYTIQDDRGGFATGTVSVTVLDVNRAPVAVNDTLTTRREMQGFVNVALNDSDADFDPLTYAVTTPPEHGEVGCAEWGGCWYTPEAAFFGADSFVYTVSDGRGGTATATVSITVTPNRLPIPVDDFLEVEQNVPASIDVLANDSDQDGNPLTVTTVANAPANGTVDCASGGNCTYTPNADFVGDDRFHYIVSDGTETAGAWVYITVRRFIARIPDWVFRPDKSLSFPVTINPPASATYACEWTFGDGGTSDQCAFEHTYDEVGTYQATTEVTFSNGVVRSDTAEIRIVAEQTGGGGGGGGNTGRGDVVESTDRTYTLDDDFDAGTLLNVNHDVPHNDELRLNREATPFPFLYVANSARGTAVRIDIDTGEILGEYFTAPDGRWRNPSRTTVDKLGNVYVTNRDESDVLEIDGVPTPMGSFARIGLLIGGTRSDADGTPNADGDYVKPPFQYSTCVDRNGDGLIRTSSGRGDILAWENTGGVDHNGGVETAVDECLITYTRVLGTNTRTVAIDSNNDAWIGGANNVHEKVDGDTGERVPGTAFNLGCGGYGGLIDGNDVLWSARYGNGLLRYDTKTGVGECYGSAIGDYGLGIDPNTGHVWHGYAFAGLVVKINPDGTEAGRFAHGHGVTQGVAVDGSSNVWLAHANAGVGRFRTDGTLVGLVDLRGGSGSTGVAVDANGRVWSANLYSDNATRIDPKIGPVGGGGFPVGYPDLTVDLGPGAGPYNYSDMTGAVSVGAASPSGFWSIVQDGGAPGTPWTKVSWNGLTPDGTEIEVEARAADTQAGLASTEFVQVVNGAVLGLEGRFIEVRANLRTTRRDATPVLQDVRIASVTNEAPAVEDGTLTTAEDTAKDVTLVATDPDGDALMYTIVDGPAHGTLSGSGASRTYTPAPNYHGSDSFTFRASDGALFDEAVVSITVTPVNDAPVAGDDAAETDEDSPLSIPGTILRANDTDVDGDLLTVTAVSDPQHGAVVLVGPTVVFTPDPNYNGLASFVYTVSDGNGGSDTATVTVTVRPVDDAPTASAIAVETDEETPVEITLLGDDPDGGEPLTFAVASGPAHGTLAGEGATLTYMPDPNYNGPDSFTYTASSGSLTSAPAKVSITVRPVNDAPVAADASVTTPEDTPVALPFAGTDVDRDELTFEIVDGPSHGSVSGQTYTPDENYHGPDAVTFQVSDGALTDEALVEITVTPVNDAPVAADDTAETVRDVPVELTSAFLLANDADVDGDALTIAEVGTAEHGTVELLDGVVTYTPDAGFFGEDSFTYTVSDGNGGSDTASVAVTVRAVNQAPVATDTTVETDEDVALDVTLAGADADGDELTFQIVSGPAHGSLSGKAPALTYTPDSNYNGSDSFTFSVSDGSLADEAVVDITINPVNDPPNAVDDAVATDEDTAVEIAGADLRANDTDVDGDSLTVSAVGAAAHGTVELLEGVVTYTPAPGFSGDDSFTYTISDGNGGTDTATVAVTVREVNDRPSADDLSVATDEDTAVDLTLAGSDPENDPLAFAVASGPAHGTVSGSGATRTYTPDADYHGPDSFTYTASDGALTSAEATVTITVRAVNDAPVARPAVVSTPEDTAVELALAASDVDGDDLTFEVIDGPAHGTLVGRTYTPDRNYHGPDSARFRASDGTLSNEAAVSITVTPVNDAPVAEDDGAEALRDTPLELPAQTLLANDADVDGDELSISAVGAAEHGTVELAGDVVTYTPEAGYVGPDSFAYTASDGNGGTDTATVSVTVRAVNRAPTAEDGTLETAEDTPKALTLVASDGDEDALAYTIVSGPEHGTLTGTGSARTYAPDADYHGPDSFHFRASDGTLADEAVVSITVTPANDPPVARDDTAATDEDTPLAIPAADLSANDSDVDGDSLIVSAISDAQHGTVVLSAGVVTFTPQAGYSGPAVFVYTLSDGNGGTDTATVSVTVRAVNDRPTAPDIAVATDEDTGVGLTLAGSDPDGDVLTFAVAAGPAHGALTGSGATRTYTPDADYHGPDSFTYTASDGALTSAPATVTITVRAVNDAPVARDDAFATDEDTALAIAGADLRGNDSDVDGDALTISAVGTAEHGAVVLEGDQVTYTPAARYSGPDTFAYTVSDGNGGTANATVSITVRAVQPAAMALVIDDESIDKDTAPNFFSAIAVNDPIARVGLRATLPAFAGDNVGRKLVLHTGGVGNEGWFALKAIPKSWATAGPTPEGLRNFLLAGPGLGSGRNRQRLLESVPDVTPLRATGLKQLVGHSVCAVVYDSDVSINYGPLTGSLKGANLGVVAVKVMSVTRLTDFSSSSLPKVEVEVLNRESTCGGPLQLLTSAPVPTSSSEPFDVVP